MVAQKLDLWQGEAKATVAVVICGNHDTRRSQASASVGREPSAGKPRRSVRGTLRTPQAHRRTLRSACTDEASSAQQRTQRTDDSLRREHTREPQSGLPEDAILVVEAGDGDRERRLERP